MNNNWGSGFVTQIIYAAGAHADDETFAILAEDSLEILTEDSKTLQTEQA